MECMFQQWLVPFRSQYFIFQHCCISVTYISWLNTLDLALKSCNVAPWAISSFWTSVDVVNLVSHDRVADILPISMYSYDISYICIFCFHWFFGRFAHSVGHMKKCVHDDIFIFARQEFWVCSMNEWYCTQYCSQNLVQEEWMLGFINIINFCFVLFTLLIVVNFISKCFHFVSCITKNKNGQTFKVNLYISKK